MTRLHDTFVISLAGANDRQATITQRLADDGVPFSFVDACDGRQFDVSNCEDYDRARRLRLFGRDLFGSEIGCYRSHVAAMRKAAESDFAYSVILEDDVKLHPRFWEIVDRVIEAVPELELVRLMGDPKTVKRGGRLLMQFDKDIALVRLPSTPGGALAYLASRDGARKLADALTRRKIAFPVDVAMGRAWETGLDHFAVLTPQLAVQNNAHPSMNSGGARFDKTIQLTGLRAALFPLWRAYFKFSDGISKRFAFYSGWPKDHELRRRGRTASDATTTA